MAPTATTANSATSAPVNGSDEVEEVGTTDGASGVGPVTEVGPLGGVVWLTPELVVTDWADANAGATSTDATVMAVPHRNRAIFVRIITSLSLTGAVPTLVRPEHASGVTTVSDIPAKCPSTDPTCRRNFRIEQN